MFIPALAEDERRAATDLRTGLAAAVQPVVVNQSPELEGFLAKKDELTTEIASIKVDVGFASLEERAALLANRESQLRIIEGELKKLRGAHEELETQAKKKAAETRAKLSSEACALLREIALNFLAQHRTVFASAAAQYSESPAQTNQLVNLFPFFSRYGRAIRRFEQNGAEAEKLVGWLDSALAGRDFIMLKA